MFLFAGKINSITAVLEKCLSFVIVPLSNYVYVSSLHYFPSSFLLISVVACILQIGSYGYVLFLPQEVDLKDVGKQGKELLAKESAESKASKVWLGTLHCMCVSAYKLNVRINQILLRSDKTNLEESWQDVYYYNIGRDRIVSNNAFVKEDHNILKLNVFIIFIKIKNSIEFAYNLVTWILSKEGFHYFLLVVCEKIDIIGGIS